MCSHRSLIVGIPYAFGKKHEIGVGIQKLLPALRIVTYPLLYALHTHFFSRESRVFDEPGAQTFVGVPVLIGVADANKRTVIKEHATGSLNLQEKRLHRIVSPANHVFLLQILARDDSLAIVVRHQLSPLKFSS